MGHFATITLPLVGVLLFNILGYCEMSIYPGLRRKPLQQSLQQPYEMSSDYLVHLMEENARRRLQQQFEQQLELINLQMNRQRQLERERQQERYRQQSWDDSAEEVDYDNNNVNANVNSNLDNSNNNNNNNLYEQYDTNNPNVDFSYKYATNELNGDDGNGRIPFAVGPTDARFYAEDNQAEQEEDEDNSLDTPALDEYEEYVPAENKPVSVYQATPLPSGEGLAGGNVQVLNSVASDRSAVLAPAPGPQETSKLLENSAISTTFHRIKPQNSAAAAAAAGVNVTPVKTIPSHDEELAPNTRHDISALIEKLQKEGKSEAILNTHDASLGHDAHVVVRQHMGMDDEMGMYVVALIAGVSAAITVGLIALVVAWYTLHAKTKAAADVEYPAYGVTGPNKDISPSGDRKLAQSAQMYHYQHQKQQIIAMENRQAAEGHCGLSDVESDDDNEEGDYTVYECPGLAPTGEMEVKNPLFLDETPVTPSGNASTTAPPVTPATAVTQATPQQPQTMRKAPGKASTSMATSSDEIHKNNKKTKN